MSCDAGFTGRLCETTLTTCDVNVCENGGTCYLLSGSAQCACADGYSGSTCSYPVCRYMYYVKWLKQ